MYEGLSLSLRPIKKQAARMLARLYIALIEKKDRRFYICKIKSGEVRNYKIWIKSLILININVNSKIIRGFRDLKK